MATCGHAGCGLLGSFCRCLDATDPEEAGCYCESRSPSSSSPQVFLPFDITDGALRFRGNLTDDYLSLHVSWPGKRLRLEDE